MTPFQLMLSIIYMPLPTIPQHQTEISCLLPRHLHFIINSCLV